MTTRLKAHTQAAAALREQALDYGGEHGGSLRVAQAIHELGVTVALALSGQEVDSEEVSALGEAVQELAQVAERHQETVQHAIKGHAPLQTILPVGVELKVALEKVLAR